MKNTYLVALAIIFLLLGAAYFKLFFAQAEFNNSIDAKTGSFILDNFDNSNIKIVTGKTDKITADIKGNKSDIDKISFFVTKDNKSGFTFSDEWQSLSGTITVPEGTLLDIRTGNKVDVILKKSNEDTLVGDSKSFLVDTNLVTSVTMEDGSVSIESVSDPVIWDTNSWESLNQSGGEGDEEAETGNEYIPPVCSVGSQAIRNYCCEETLGSDLNQPACDGYGYYIFNNVFRECEFICEESEDEQVDEGDEQDCSIGSQSVRDNCCAYENISEDTSQCIGRWEFNNSTRICEYNCFNEDELDDYFGGDDDNNNNPSIILCANFTSQQDRDECCDYNLANELSIGPRPGFPDCIGRWYFDSDNGCSFRCAEYTEMLEILKELQQKAAQEQ
ncbi:hypothetical protein JW758_01780 [Candidatus Peregrinibacteria bacterium]|nr:hypothetical protein [Candidatus Peregrinibacteria bacterium]